MLINLRDKSCFASHFDGADLGWNVVFIVGYWLIWKWRCKCLFEPEFSLLAVPLNVLVNYAKDMMVARSSKLVDRYADQILVA